MAPEVKARGNSKTSKPAAARSGRKKNSDKDNERDEDEQQWAYDESVEVETKVPSMFPDIMIPIPPPPTASELFDVAEYRKFRKHVRDGTLYTVMGDNSRVSKHATKARRIMNPFEDMPSWAQRYKQPVRTMPEFKQGTYSLHLFPRVLWDTLDPSLRASQKSRQRLARRRQHSEGLDGDIPSRRGLAANEDDDEQAAKDDDLTNPEDEDAAEELDPDENFSDEDSEMGGDYNAEQYFDGGDEDLEDFGGDDGGGEDYGD